MPELLVRVEFCRLASSVRSVIGVNDLGWDSEERFGEGPSKVKGGRRYSPSGLGGGGLEVEAFSSR